MFRRALTYQLILAVAVGPLLCCCTTGQLLASPFRPAGPAPISQSSAGTARITSPCCAHKHQPAKSKQDRGHSDHKPAPSKPGEKCPCKDDSSKSKAVEAETISVGASTFLRALTLDLVGPFLTVDGASCLTRLSQEALGSRGWNASFLSTADLLFAHHNLRC